jgi:hypothetical protein
MTEGFQGDEAFFVRDGDGGGGEGAGGNGITDDRKGGGEGFVLRIKSRGQR